VAAAAVSTSGTISTAAGTGVAGSLDTSIAATSRLDTPSDVAALADGGFLIADTANGRVRAVRPSGAVASLPGGSTPSAATALVAPLGVASGPDGVLVTDGNRILRMAGGAVTRVAGDSSPGFAGDGGSALSARLDVPAGIAALPSGGFVVADMGNHRIRKVQDGRITTVAGRGSAGLSGDGGPAVDADLRLPADVAVLEDGDLLVADMGNGRIRRVDDATGAISTVAGGGADHRDGVRATWAALPQPRSVTAVPGGGFAVSVAGTHRVRHVRADGTIATLAGTGAAGSSGDGGPGTAAALDAPSGLAVAQDGRLLVADRAAHRVRALELDLHPVDRPLGGQDPSEGDKPSEDDAPSPGPQPSRGQEPSPGQQPAPGQEPAPAQPSPAEPPPADGSPASGGSGAEPSLAGAAPTDAAIAAAGAPAAPAPEPEPELGRAVVVAPVAGTILVRLPGARTLTPLGPGAEIPVGSLLDARRGTVALTSALPGGRTQSGRFSGGQFSVTQPRSAKGMTELTLRGPELGSCRPTSGATARAAARRKPVRRLWGQDKGGRFRTRGRNSVATVRGTRWLTEDTCAGTRTRVLEGAVDVWDVRRKVTRRVRAGGSLLIRAARG